MADRKTTITLGINDQFSGPLRQFEQGLHQMVTATQSASASIDTMEAKNVSLHQILGSSRREASLLEQTFVSLTGTTGALSQGLGALASGFGPVGLLITGIGVAGGIAKEKMDEWAASIEKMRLALVRAADERANPAAATKAQVDDAMKAIEEQTKTVSAELEMLTRRAADVQKVLAYHDTPEGREALDYFNAQIKTSTDRLNELRSAAHALGGSIIPLDAIDTPAQHLEAFSDIVRDFKRGLDESRIAASAAGDAYNKTIAADATGAESLVQSTKVLVQSWSDFNADSVKFSGAQKTADSLAKSIAALNKQFSDEGAAAIAVYGDKAAAAFGAINNSTLDTQHKLQAFAIWERNTLPANIQQRINAYLAVNGDAFLMKLLGLKGGGNPAGGHQQGDEYNFTLGGEDNATRNRYYDMYGPALAEQMWERDHRQELKDRYGVTGPGQPNTETGDTYDYSEHAMGMHETVSAPRTITVGERGPERVDVTPGGGGGMGNIVTINWSSLTVPNAYEMQQLARRLNQAMANDGA